MLLIIFIGIISNVPGQDFSVTTHLNEKTEGSLQIDGKVMDMNNTGLYSQVMIKFKNGSYKFDETVFFTDSLGVFHVVLKRGVRHRFVIGKIGYKWKEIIVNTKKGGRNVNGYQMPIEVTLEEG